MDDFFNLNIKDLIAAHPAIAQALERYNIGCTTCALGTCKLKDVIEIHNPSEDDEKTLFAEIAEVLYPGQHRVIAPLPRKREAGVVRKLSPPLRMLVEEHVHIMRVVSAIPALVKSAGEPTNEQFAQIGKGIDFIRKYADKFHHAKEEDILFCLFDQSQEIIQIMRQEHEIGRGLVKAALLAVEQRNLPAAAKNLSEYGILLTNHIRKEDDILYPWMDRELADEQVGKLFSKFQVVDKEFAEVARTQVAFSLSLA